MKKELLIQKWLDGELNDAELTAFKALPEYASYTKLSEKAKLFEDTSYDVELEYSKINAIIKERRQETPVKTLNWIKPLMRVAAIFIVGLAIYYAPLYGDTTTVKTLASNQTTVQLPDNSSVKLNAASSLQYKKGDWKNNREVNLVGEAFFDVAEGSQFDVNTWLGKVSVLGTQFNVKQRVNYFEVTCYDGLVSVNYKGMEIKLSAGKSFKVIGNETFEIETQDSLPTWSSKNMSSFKSVPFSEVINEFERQYNIKVETKNVDTSQLFTGSFALNDKELALKAITLPLQLKYNEENKTKIVLTKE
ncbi:FecR family protein [Aureibaculum sp. 2210JD6-5]|uniref:FecR family protein n=1 Tax=Aureibaculum sp. 2210JD6-5 TaxID=3103957 RepID=UPI002AAE5D56|nr:FecR family protein [Aureibaculum sp. 2210JD6-5]MDY7394878.1 FecR family protein [Aureibaculum sp. 2210JD6-5]